MGRWRSYTPEEREARRLSDKHIRDTAEHKRADPEWVRRMTCQAAELPAESKLTHYSDRNRALLYSQAEERGLDLSDVDTVKGWRERGRKVRRGQKGMRIVAPRRRKQPSQGHGQQPDDEDDDVTFRMVSVFDVSQTEPLDTAAAASATATGGGVA